MELLHTIIYATNNTVLKNKEKFNEARHMITGVHKFGRKGIYSHFRSNNNLNK